MIVFCFNPIAFGGGGGGFGRAIRLAARTLEPLHLESPKFLASDVIFRTRGHEKLEISKKESLKKYYERNEC